MRSTILCKAIGVVFRKLNLNTATAHNITVMLKQIGVVYILIGITCKEPSTFTVIGIRTAIINKMACFENIPEFLIAYLNKYINPIAYNKYACRKSPQKLFH